MTPPFAVRGCYVLFVPQNTNRTVVWLTRQDTASGMRIAVAVLELLWGAFLRPYSLTYPRGKVKEKLDLIGLKFRAVPILTKESREKYAEIRIYHRVIVNKL